ncbi:hypothetical protein EM595_1210 [Duffyella gerundensis]|uniref:Uncharacterized protein n=1 Tax=Duffyella gerundensis TaxID=1619313 RepID=A0A0U5L315_9GAMM|nr:hypothetical protein EM595_1210 [Duffyella gerundensis]
MIRYLWRVAKLSLNKRFTEGILILLIFVIKSGEQQRG